MTSTRWHLWVNWARSTPTTRQEQRSALDLSNAQCLVVVEIKTNRGRQLIEGSIGNKRSPRYTEATWWRGRGTNIRAVLRGVEVIARLVGR